LFLLTANVGRIIAPAFEEVQVRSGVVGLMPGHPRDITPATAVRLRELGFTGVTVIVPDPLTARRDEYERAGAILRDGGIAVAQANPRYEVLIHPDPELRSRGILGLQAACTCARWLGAGTVYVRPGSLNPAGPWTPHPENTSVRTLLRLVDSLQRAVGAAETVGVPLAIEGGSVCSLDTPERVRDVIQAVGSPALRFNVDPVNFVRNLDELFTSTTLVNRLFDVCGDLVVCAHVKDITYENSIPLRLREVPLSQGIFDNVAFLRRFEQSCPDGFVLIEHLPDDLIPAAKRALDGDVARAEITWRQ
jgi:sugar phosphate isomerase/epimerase